MSKIKVGDVYITFKNNIYIVNDIGDYDLTASLINGLTDYSITFSKDFFKKFAKKINIESALNVCFVLVDIYNAELKLNNSNFVYDDYIDTLRQGE